MSAWLSFQSMDVPSEIFPKFRSITIHVRHSSSVIRDNLIFSSRPLHLNKHKTVFIGESFPLFNVTMEDFLKVDLLVQPTDPSNQPIFRSITIFVGDLSDHSHSLVFPLVSNLKIRLNHSHTGELSPVVRRVKIRSPSTDDSEPSIIDSLLLTKKTLSSISCLRRLQDDIKGFVAKRDFGRDLRLLMWAAVVVSWPRLSLVSAVLVLQVRSVQHRLRTFIGRKTGEYFSEESSMAEIQRNGQFMHQGQQQMYQASVLLRRLLLKRDRTPLQLLLTKGLVIPLALVIALSLPLGLVLWLTLLTAVLAKYYWETMAGVVSRLLGGREGVGALPVYRRGRGETVFKEVGGYECQRWFLIKGFVGDDFEGERKKLWDGVCEWSFRIREVELREGWEWAGPWEISMTECDSKGWQYASSYTDSFGPTQVTSSLVRRRKWKRLCLLKDVSEQTVKSSRLSDSSKSHSNTTNN